MLLLTILTLCTVLTVLKIYEYSYKTRLINKIPGPKAWPLIGNSHNILLPLDALFIYLRQIKKEYGGIYQLYACNIRSVNISNPAYVEIILSSSRFIEKRYPYTFFKPWLCEGLLTSNGSKWHQRRKLLTNAFHFNMLKKYFQEFTEHTEKLLNIMQSEVNKDATNILPLVSKATLGIMFDTAMGIPMHGFMDKQSGYDKYFKGIKIIGETIAQRVCRIWFYSDTLFSYSKIGNAQKKAIKDLHEFSMKIILNRKSNVNDNNILKKIEDGDEINSRNGRLAMLDLLLENEKRGMINLEGIREEVDTFMFEGHDTTAMALCFMMMRIANESEVQNSIYEEMCNVFGQSQRCATLEDLNKMMYLECCIKESLRIYPSVPFIARYITKEVVLSGYKVPKGTLCHIHIYDMHHSDHLFPEAEKFIPERFLPENSTRRHPYSFIPFSAGPRNCIGQKFALLELKTVLSSLLRSFRLEPVTKPEDITFTGDIVLRTNHPIYVRFHPRQLAKANNTTME